MRLTFALLIILFVVGCPSRPSVVTDVGTAGSHSDASAAPSSGGSVDAGTAGSGPITLLDGCVDLDKMCTEANAYYEYACLD